MISFLKKISNNSHLDVPKAHGSVEDNRHVQEEEVLEPVATKKQGVRSKKERDKRLEHELDRLNSKIDGLLFKLDTAEPDLALSRDEQCRCCMRNRATMQTFPCTHRVTCKTCFVKRIRKTVEQKKLPLRCVSCQAKILSLRQCDKELGDDQASTLSASSSNFSFASGISSVSSGSSTCSTSSRSVKSLNFDTLASFQSVKLLSDSQLPRSNSANLMFRRGSRSRSKKSQSPMVGKRAQFHVQSRKLVLCDDVEEDMDSLTARVPNPWESNAPVTSSEPPKKPSATSKSSSKKQKQLQKGSNVVHSECSTESSPSSPLSGATTASSTVSSSVKSTRSLRLGTPLSPIRESRRECFGGGSPDLGRFSPAQSPIPVVRNPDFRRWQQTGSTRNKMIQSNRIKYTDRLLRQLEGQAFAKLHLLEESDLAENPSFLRQSSREIDDSGAPKSCQPSRENSNRNSILLQTSVSSSSERRNKSVSFKEE